MPRSEIDILDFWSRIYQLINGKLNDCPGYLCPVSCCRSASVLIFPTEKIYLEHKYGDLIKPYFVEANDGYFLLEHCSQDGQCSFFSYRSLVCRSYPCLAIPDDDRKELIFQIDTDYCPIGANLSDEFISICKIAWEKVARFHGYTFREGISGPDK